MSTFEAAAVIITFTTIGLLSVILAMAGYSLISGLITLSLIISFIFIMLNN